MQERPPPVPPSRPYTVNGSRRITFPQTRIMTHNFPGNFQIAKKSDFELHYLIFFRHGTLWNPITQRWNCSCDRQLFKKRILSCGTKQSYVACAISIPSNETHILLKTSHFIEKYKNYRKKSCIFSVWLILHQIWLSFGEELRK